jgi:hypothetical protein
MSPKRTAKADRRQAWRWGCPLLMAAALLALAGCATGSGATAYDPLRGGRPLPSTPSSLTRGGGDRGDVPLPATDQGITAPAALASGTSPPPDDRPAATGVKVLPPRPTSSTTQPSTNGGNKTAPATGPVSANEASYEQLQQMLQSRGVVWQHLRTGAERGEWLFICAVPNPTTPGVQRHYEARAVGPNGLAAIRAVLNEIDEDQKQRGNQ